MAIGKTQIEAIVSLAENGGKLRPAEVNARDEKGCTPLHYAAAKGSITAIGNLAKAGAKLDARDNEKRTPLHYAAANGQVKAIELLLDEGANLMAGDQGGRMAAEYAVVDGQQMAVNVFAARKPEITSETARAVEERSKRLTYLIQEMNKFQQLLWDCDLPIEERTKTYAFANAGLENASRFSEHKEVKDTESLIMSEELAVQLSNVLVAAGKLRAGDVPMPKGYANVGEKPSILVMNRYNAIVDEIDVKLKNIKNYLANYTVVGNVGLGSDIVESSVEGVHFSPKPKPIVDEGLELDEDYVGYDYVGNNGVKRDVSQLQKDLQTLQNAMKRFEFLSYGLDKSQRKDIIAAANKVLARGLGFRCDDRLSAAIEIIVPKELSEAFNAVSEATRPLYNAVSMPKMYNMCAYYDDPITVEWRYTIVQNEIGAQLEKIATEQERESKKQALSASSSSFSVPAMEQNEAMVCDVQDQIIAESEKAAARLSVALDQNEARIDAIPSMPTIPPSPVPRKVDSSLLGNRSSYLYSEGLNSTPAPGTGIVVRRGFKVTTGG